MKRRLLLAASLLVASACHSPTALAAWEDKVGPAPNLPIATLGGSQLWADTAWREGWRVQRHAWTGHHRLLDARNVRRAWGTEERCTALLSERAQPEPEGTHLVVLLHGMGRTRRSMHELEGALTSEGYRVARLSYASTRNDTVGHASNVLSVLKSLEGVDEVSFVTHSLGGIVARQALTSSEWPEGITARALVQMAPPNGGAQFARRVNIAPIRLLVGPSFTELAGAGDFPVPDVPITVITGTGGHNPLVQGADDWVVGVEEAQLPGANLTVLSGVGHTYVMDDPRAWKAALRALR